MNKNIESLALSSGAIKNGSSNNYKKSSRESFQSIFNKVMMDKEEKTSANNSDTSERTNISNVSDTEGLHQYYEDQLEHKADMAVGRLASFFGIGKELMKEMLKSLHINPEDLVDTSRKDEVIKAIIKQFGLSKDRAEALSELIKEF